MRETLQINQLKRKMAHTIPSSSLKKKEIYKKFCLACHQSGHMSAPLIDQCADWQIRLLQSEPMLWNHVQMGYGKMPPKGGCSLCDDDEVWHAFLLLRKQIKKSCGF